MNDFGRIVIVAMLLTLTACGQQPTEDETPLSADEQNWRQYGVDDPRMIDWMDMHLNTRMESDRSLAQAVEQLDRIREAVVIRTDYSAYVAVRTTAPYGSGGTELSSTMKSRIILAIKTIDSKITNVYASMKPDVYRTLSDYAAKLENGVPERQLVQAFNKRMQQFFPYSELGQ